MKRYFAVVLFAIALCLSAFPASAQARSCHYTARHQVCFVEIKRSAKYHWQYRVKATVDGKPQPQTRYNCRDRTRTPMAGLQKGLTTKFAAHGVGELVCKLVKR